MTPPQALRGDLDVKRKVSARSTHAAACCATNRGSPLGCRAPRRTRGHSARSCPCAAISLRQFASVVFVMPRMAAARSRTRWAYRALTAQEAFNKRVVGVSDCRLTNVALPVLLDRFRGVDLRLVTTESCEQKLDILALHIELTMDEMQTPYAGNSAEMRDLKEAVFDYLLDEGRQSTCQISVALGASLESVATALRALEVEGARVRRLDLPAHLHKYQVLDSRGNPAVFLYEAAPDSADKGKRLVYLL